MIERTNKKHETVSEPTKEKEILNNKEEHMKEKDKKQGQPRKASLKRPSTFISSTPRTSPVKKAKSTVKKRISNTQDSRSVKRPSLTCGCKMNLQGVYFCVEHLQSIFDGSTVDDLIKFTVPILQQRVPMPVPCWREKYPIRVRKCENVEVLAFKSSEMKVLYNAQIFSHSKVIYMCDVCLEHYEDRKSFIRHCIKCSIKNIGKLIYSENSYRNTLTVYEIDGERHKSYCRKLCIVGKFFLEHKTLFYDVEPFLFYVLFSNNNFVGFFSKEKVSSNNLSCIVVLPVFQGKGYGFFLVDFSYKLSIGEGKVGTPEKPLSEMGLAAYKRYWMSMVYKKLKTKKNNVVINEISKELGMDINDVIYGLELLCFIRERKGEFYIEFKERKIACIRECKNDCFV